MRGRELRLREEIRHLKLLVSSADVLVHALDIALRNTSASTACHALAVTMGARGTGGTWLVGPAPASAACRCRSATAAASAAWISAGLSDLPPTMAGIAEWLSPVPQRAPLVCSFP